MKYAGLITIALVAIATGYIVGVNPAHAATFTVNTTGNGQDANTGDIFCDSDLGTGGEQCTLRAAMEQANAPNFVGLDSIAFSIPTSDPNYNGATGTFRIQPLSPLPLIGDPVIIDGRTQPEFVDKPVIELNGFSAGSGADALRITTGGSGSTVRGLVINQFGQTNGADGIEIEGGGNNTIEGNFIGVDVTGTITDPDQIAANGDELGTTGSGIFINGSSNNRIGGVGSGTDCIGATNPCNIISGAGRGVFTDAHGVEIAPNPLLGTGATGNRVEGNIIGLDITGVFDRGNKGDGVNINGAANNTIGGDAPAKGNAISANDNVSGGGVQITGGPEAGSFCTGNADNDGDGAINDGCPQAGATAESGSQCGTNSANDDSADDALVNDGCPGVAVASGNRLEGNFIGLQSSGLAKPTGTQFYGVLINGAPGNFIGTAGGAINVISANLTGIQIQGASATGNIVQRNYIGTEVTGTFDVGGPETGARCLDNVDSDGDTRVNDGCPMAGGAVENPLTQCVNNTNDDPADDALVNDGCPAVQSPIGNIASGVIIASGASNNTVGGTAAGAGNLVSGNDNQGIEINGSTTTGNVVQSNFIGTTAAGTAPLPNGQPIGGSSGRGIRINGAPANTIGGPTAGRNVISGNFVYGVEIFAAGASGNLIQSNYIGTDATATVAVGNREGGVVVDGAPNTVIGGTGLGNVISGNGQGFAAAVGITVLGGAATGTQVQGNLIGTNVNGTTAVGNLGIGVLIIGASASTIGGTSASARNIISGNGIHGVEIDAAGGTGNLVQGNYIGLNISGDASLANGGNGVLISDAPGNTVGGTAAGAGNVISANGSMGVEMVGIASSANTVQGNFIGTDAGGGLDFGNAQHGVFVNGAPNNIIGGTSAAARNIISGNGTGVFIQNGGATGNLVRGNRIGTNAAGTGALGNTFDGVRVGGNASSNSIGGSTTGAGNTIAFNGANGVVVDSGSGNSILSNSIHTSTSLGIDLGLDGVSANDAGDGDGGANTLQNYPVLSAATGYLTITRVTGTFNSTPNTTFTLQVFASATCDPSSFGEGATFLGSFSVVTDGSGNASFTNQSVPTGGSGNQQITATATDPNGNTSEFSVCRLAGISNDQDADTIPDLSDNCPLEPNTDQLNADGDSQGNACDLDDDNDKVNDIDEQNCGGNSTNQFIRPERIDGSFDNVSDDGDGQIDEALPPGSENYDCDGDGFKGSAESHVGTNDQDPCGNNGWPADLQANNALDIQDLASFVAPTRRLNTSPGDQDFNQRWDLVPGTIVGDHINVTDLAALVSGPTAYPPMFAPVPPATGGRAFGQTCPWP